MLWLIFFIRQAVCRKNTMTCNLSNVVIMRYSLKVVLSGANFVKLIQSVKLCLRNLSI